MNRLLPVIYYNVKCVLYVFFIADAITKIHDSLLLDIEIIGVEN